MDALKLLKEDHDKVDQMFRKFDRMKEGDERKEALVQQILEEVRVHAQVEEEIFYPALRAPAEEAGKRKEVELLDEAEVEHDSAKTLMEQIERGEGGDSMRDARVKVLGEYIRHHVKEEEGEIFKAARKLGLDLEQIGRQLDARKRQLKGEAPAEAGGDEAMGAGAMQVSEPEQMVSPLSTH
jgi:hemerythrin-like domain-containing protein